MTRPSRPIEHESDLMLGSISGSFLANDAYERMVSSVRVQLSRCDTPSGALQYPRTKRHCNIHGISIFHLCPSISITSINLILTLVSSATEQISTQMRMVQISTQMRMDTLCCRERLSRRGTGQARGAHLQLRPASSALVIPIIATYPYESCSTRS